MSSNAASVPLAGRILALDTVAAAARNKRQRERQQQDNDEYLAKARGWEVGVELDAEPSALASIAARAFAAMKISAQSQAILFRGDGNVDKQSQVALLLSHISSLSSKKAHKIHQRIAAAQIVLAALTTSSTSTCTQSSGMAHATSLMFDDKHKIIGARTRDYLLNKSLVHTVPTESRTFPIFYALLAGAAPDQRAQWKLSADPSHWAFLASGSNVVERSDAEALTRFLGALKTLGLSKKSQTHVLAVVAAILHLGQIQYADEMRSDVEEPETRVRNPDVLEHVAGLLGIAPDMLEQSLLSHTSYIGVDRCSVVHTAVQAAEYSRKLAAQLYGLLVHWIVEFANSRMSPAAAAADSGATAAGATHASITVVVFPGHQDIVDPTPANPNGSGLWAELANFAEARLDRFVADAITRLTAEFSAEGLASASPVVTTPDEPDTRVARRRHAAENAERVSLDVVQLFRAHCKNAFVAGLFALPAVSEAVAAQERAAANPASIAPGKVGKVSTKKRKSKMQASAEDLSVLSGATLAGARAAAATVLDEVDAALRELVSELADDNVFLLFCGHAHAASAAASDAARPLLASGVGNHVARSPLSRVVARYGSWMSASLGMDDARPVRDRLAAMFQQQLKPEEYALGREAVYVSWRGIVALERELKKFKEWKKQQREDGGAGGSQYSSAVGGPGAAHLNAARAAAFDDNASYASEDETYMSDNASMYDGYSIAGGPGYSVIGGANTDAAARSVMNGGATGARSGGAGADGYESQGDAAVATTPMIEKRKTSSSRKRWVCFTWAVTFWIPGFLLSWVGRMKDKNVQMAWREKVALCFLIFLLSAAMLFVIAIAGLLVCPSKNRMFSANEMDYLSNAATSTKKYAAVYGNVYDLNRLIVASPSPYHTAANFATLVAQDISTGFPRDPKTYCSTLVSNGQIAFGNTDVNKTAGMAVGAAHANPLASNPNFGPTVNSWLASKTFRAGNLAIPIGEVLGGWTWDIPYKRFVVNGVIYDLTDYYNNAAAQSSNKAQRFLASDFSGSANVLNIDTYIASQASQGIVDLTSDTKFMAVWNNGKSPIAQCIMSLYTSAVVDDRQTWKCLYADWILLAMSIVLCCVILFKFLAALQLRGGTETPEKMDKFVMIQVPCYTEDEVSMVRTINSIASLKYDDKRKLMVIICDGMIVGRGNDRPTPRIVLDILGVDPTVDPEPLSYQAVGLGAKQHNCAKVYSGLYEYEGHLVPYVVLVKVGKPSETQRPGNRGKRDSQIMLMRFLNHLHYEKPMSPMELEMRHHIQTIIGVDPKWYEYMLMIDADTTVDDEALTHLVAFAMSDTEIIGCCGETRLMNEKSSMTTMIQVYEYFISHHLSKAFESLFGTVTCLPGCFSMYRIITANRGRPMLCTDLIIEEYSDVRVDTLHKKNLLSLGEDRYLTTLIMKNFPNYKTKFTPAALAYTFAPETFSVLLSQRRRWINSTFHNLFELAFLKGLCGFCCFSMRFMVMIDLVATIIQPATVLYLGYLIYLTVHALLNDESLNLVMVSLILIASMYGLQAIIFILKKEFSHVVWMLIYILAMPVFSFFIPVYSFWRMDDFSWGNTRVILGGKGEKQVLREEDEMFDLSTIQHMTWAEYQSELMETQSQVSHLTDMERERELREMRELQSGSRPMSMLSKRLSVGSAHSLLQGNAGAYAGMPSDDEIVNEVHRILQTADLMRVTKKQIREELSALFGIDLNSRKEFINGVIDSALRDSM
ncbi:chitin synthase-domain-containing protein [Blastocladiella britannica]|nr:chitin synthase-domain-containing protein [Blastocladiella britannica]